MWMPSICDSLTSIVVSDQSKSSISFPSRSPTCLSLICFHSEDASSFFTYPGEDAHYRRLVSISSVPGNIRLMHPHRGCTDCSMSGGYIVIRRKVSIQRAHELPASKCVICLNLHAWRTLLRRSFIQQKLFLRDPSTWSLGGPLY